MTAEFTIQGKLNSSVQIGDNLYFALKTSNSGYQVSNNFIHAGVITDLIQGTTQSTIKFNFTKGFVSSHHSPSGSSSNHILIFSGFSLIALFTDK